MLFRRSGNVLFGVDHSRNPFFHRMWFKCLIKDLLDVYKDIDLVL